MIHQIHLKSGAYVFVVYHDIRLGLINVLIITQWFLHVHAEGGWIITNAMTGQYLTANGDNVIVDKEQSSLWNIIDVVEGFKFV